jgi:hypothetical protein
MALVIVDLVFPTALAAVPAVCFIMYTPQYRIVRFHQYTICFYETIRFNLNQLVGLNHLPIKGFEVCSL